MGMSKEMKILFFATSFKDFGLDVLFDGLCRVLGPDNVLEYPEKAFLHGKTRHRLAMYPDAFNYPILKSDSEKLEMLRNGAFDVVLFGCRPEKELLISDRLHNEFQNTLKILKENNKGTPVYIIDHGDHTGINTNVRSDVHAELYFKREYLKDEEYNSDVIPIPFSYSEKYIPAHIDTPRTNTLFWVGREYPHLSIRTPYLAPLEKMRGEKFTAKLTREEYAAELLKHKIGLSLRGYGYDTTRYWELPAFGVMLFSEKLKIRIPNDYTDGETAVFFSSPEEMIDKLKFYSEHESEVDRIRANGNKWFHTYHTSTARAEQVLEKIKKNLGILA